MTEQLQQWQRQPQKEHFEEVTELPGWLVGQLHRAQACTSKPVFTPGHVLFPTMLGRGSRRGHEGKELEGRCGADRPGSLRVGVKLLKGPHPLPGRQRPPEKKNRLDLFKWNVMPDFPCTPQGGARASSLLSSGLPQVTQRDPVPNSWLRLENFRYSHPTCSQVLAKLAPARLDYFSLPPATLRSACCSLPQPGH